MRIKVYKIFNFIRDKKNMLVVLKTRNKKKQFVTHHDILKRYLCVETLKLSLFCNFNDGTKKFKYVIKNINFIIKYDAK